MSKLVSISAVLGIAMSSAILISSPSLAEQMKFKADMSASQVVPPNDSAGKGTAHITFDTASRKLSWTIEYSGLTGPLPRNPYDGHTLGAADDFLTASSDIIEPMFRRQQYSLGFDSLVLAVPSLVSRNGRYSRQDTAQDNPGVRAPPPKTIPSQA